MDGNGGMASVNPQFSSASRWLPKAEYEAKKREEQAQMRLGHSDCSGVKLENMMLPLLVHFLFNLYLADLGHYQVVCQVLYPVY